MNPRLIFKLILVIYSCMLPPAQLVAQAIARAPEQAIQRIDAFVDQFRKTGDMRSRLADLAQAESELAASNRVFAARGDWSALALGLLKQGHVYRMQGQWPNAIELYQQAEAAANATKTSFIRLTRWRGKRWPSPRVEMSGRLLPTRHKRCGLRKPPRTKTCLRGHSTFSARCRSPRGISPARPIL